MRQINAIIFDLDGTLVDSIADLADSMNSVLRCMGYPIHETESYKHMVGDGVRVFAERALLGSSPDEATIELCLNNFKKEYAVRWATKTRPYMGISELLTELETRQIGMNILSNKVDHFTKLTVSRFFTRTKFDYVIGANPSLPKKPDPEGALWIAQKVGIPPQQFIFLGDTNTDMMTAVSAEMCPVGVLWGFRGEKELREHGAIDVIAHPEELLPLIDGLA